MPSCVDKFDFALAAQPANADEKNNVAQRIRSANSIKSANSDANLVIEAVPESLELKHICISLAFCCGNVSFGPSSCQLNLTRNSTKY
jgi:3-hydroxyacyl-CoA dehydrogenase